MKKIYICIMACCICLIFTACGKQESYLVSDYDISEEAEITSNSQDEEAAVYVCGAVINPGVYRLKADAIKEEAVALAGGFAEGASREYINLAEHIADGERIYVPYESELEPQAFDTQTYDSAYSSDGRLNINRASKEDFMTLSGIGEAKAEAIVAYREEHGLFGSIDEIMNVNGIKDGVYNNIKDYITLN